MIEILSADPGVTTGLARLDNGEFKSFEFKSDRFPHPHEALFETLNALKPKIIIYEAFHFRQNMDGTVFTGVEFIGVIELYAQLNGIEIIKITPSDGKGFWDDRKLKVMGLHNPGHPHGNDAMRILLRVKMKDSTWMKQALEKLKNL